MDAHLQYHSCMLPRYRDNKKPKPSKPLKIIGLHYYRYFFPIAHLSCCSPTFAKRANDTQIGAWCKASGSLHAERGGQASMKK